MAKKTARKTSAKRRYGQAASKSVETAMRRKNKGTLRSGKGGLGGKVTSRKQAIAIGLSEARDAGAKVPQNPNQPRSRKTAKSKKTKPTTRKPATSAKRTRTRT